MHDFLLQFYENEQLQNVRIIDWGKNIFLQIEHDIFLYKTYFDGKAQVQSLVGITIQWNPDSFVLSFYDADNVHGYFGKDGYRGLWYFYEDDAWCVYDENGLQVRGEDEKSIRHLAKTYHIQQRANMLSEQKMSAVIDRVFFAYRKCLFRSS